MFKPLHIIPHGTRIDFMRFHRPTFILSVIMVVGSIILLATRGLNYGIDFAGGILVEVRNEKAVDLGALRTELGSLGLGEVSLQEFGSPNDVLIRLPRQAGNEVAQQEAVAKLRQALGEGWEYRRTESVGPKVGEELIQGAFIAFILAMAGIMGYVWFRYEWQFGLNALLALFHDCITTLGLFSLLGLQFDLTIVAAVLTIAGYSVNDTVVIYDRIRYDLRRYRKMPMRELINTSLNTTLSRTTVTSGLTLLSVIALYFFGGQVIEGFALAMIWGIVIGTYSTICVATPLLLYAKLRRDKPKNETEAAAPEVGS